MKQKIFNTTITPTKKGHRVWIQGLAEHGWHGGDTFTTTIDGDWIVYAKATTGKLRKVTAGKHGGLIDTTSKKVTAWVGECTRALVCVSDTCIVIKRN